MILSSADLKRILGGNQIIRLSAQVEIVENKPALSGREGLFIYIKRYPELAEFEATFTLWIESDGSEPDDIVIAELKKLLPKVWVTPGLMTEVKTTEFRSESTLEAPQAAPGPQVDISGLEARFEALAEDIQDQMLLVHSGRPGRDGADGRDGVDGRDGRDLVATDAVLEDLQNVEEVIAKQDGQVLTWKDGVWQNLFVPQLVGSIGGGGGGVTQIVAGNNVTIDPVDGTGVVTINAASSAGTLPNGSYANQPLTWNGSAWAAGSEIQLDTTNTTDPAEGGLTWEQDEHTAVLGINGIHAHIGHDSFVWARNNTGSTITKGTAVMFVGTLGNSGRLLVAPMVADGTYPGYVFLGLAAEDIAPGVDGNVYTQGKIKGVDTGSFAEGSILWCDPAVPGGLTEAIPEAPSVKLPIAAVISSQNNGTLMVRAKTGERLRDLHDVQVSAPHDGDVLTYVAASNRWEHLPPADTGIPEAPLDGNYYVRSLSTWVKLTDALAALGVSFVEPVDAGNFTSGLGTAVTDRLYDGGDFTTGTSSALDSTTLDGGLTTS